MKKWYAVLAVCVIGSLLGAAYAQDAAGSSSLEDELFGGDSEAVMTPEQANEETKKNGTVIKGDLNTATLSLENTKLRIGGSLNADMGLKYLWLDPYTKKTDTKQAFLNPDQALLQPTIGANLFFDARPAQDLKLYGKFLFAFPFEKSLNGTASIPKEQLPPAASAFLKNGVTIPTTVNGSPNIKIWELYTDFSTKDIAFFRFGKHTVKWGTGYFYSPADVINISRIDPQKPTEDREGPVSLRTHIVIPKTQYNIWLYFLPDTKEFKPQYTAGAAKAEFVFGDWELGIGGWYRYKKAPRFISTLSGSIAGKVAVFAEGVFAWGSDHTYHKNDADFTAYEVKNKPFFQATLGGAYTHDKSHTSIAFQYYYNGFGYAKDTGLANNAAKSLRSANSETAQKAQNALQNLASMGNPGQHYIAFTLSQNKIGTENVSASLFQQFAVTEREGLTTLSLNWKIFKFVQMSTGPVFSYPLSSSSYSKGSIGYNLTFTLGGGKF